MQLGRSGGRTVARSCYWHAERNWRSGSGRSEWHDHVLAQRGRHPSRGRWHRLHRRRTAPGAFGHQRQPLRQWINHGLARLGLEKILKGSALTLLLICPISPPCRRPPSLEALPQSAYGLQRLERVTPGPSDPFALVLCLVPDAHHVGDRVLTQTACCNAQERVASH